MTPLEPWFTWANLATAVRVVACVIIFAYSSIYRDETANYVGLGTYWVLDVLDGFLARRFDQETRLGAQMDILADRLLVAFFYL
ncbi:MAG TPA: CDP-alcohol phosphatidyltransferase family protein, partial [Kofleriaceae bacterium]